MTENEAIEYQKSFKENFSDFERINIACDMAIQALEKQIPKKPIAYKGTNRADCPICNKTVRGIDKPYGNYYSGCGQKLDWGR